MTIPPRWQRLLSYFRVLHAPLLDSGVEGYLCVERAGPDGNDWSRFDRRFVALADPDPSLELTRVVARLAGATGRRPVPGPDGQGGDSIHYIPAALERPRRLDRWAIAVGAIVLDIDDRDHGGRRGTLAALAQLPRPTATVLTGGGVHAAFVLREAVQFPLGDEAVLATAARGFFVAALGMQDAVAADSTAWPSHLFRCPQTFHLKDPTRPVLVEVDVDSGRFFNLSDLGDFASAIDPDRVEVAVAEFVARRTGRSRSLASLASLDRTLYPIDPKSGKPSVVLPRRVSRDVMRLLNVGRHPKYERRNGTLDRSRAVYAAALSLLAARLKPEQVTSIIIDSALRPILDEKGADAARWLGHQIGAAQAYLAKQRGQRSAS
jgi:hypothetical protein